MEIKREVSYTKNTKYRDVYAESHGDYVLPDYQGDVRKILFTEATLRPSGRFAGGDEVEFSGVVVYNIIYLDAENNLVSVEFTSDYDYSVKCKGESYRDSVSDTRVSNYAIRLIGPRKFSARTSLVGSVHLSESDTLGVSGDAFDVDSSPEVNQKTVAIRKSALSSVSEREYAEKLCHLDGAMMDEVSVIYSRAEAIADSLEMEDEKVRVKGKIHVNAVIHSGDSPAYSLERQIPFDEEVEFSGMTQDMRLLPQLTVSSLKTVVNADEAGCEVVANAILEICVLGECNEKIDITTDSYLKSCPTDNVYDKFSYETLADVVSVKGTHNAEVDRSELETDGLYEVIFLTATPKVERVDLQDGSISVVGELRYSGIASEVVNGDLSYVGVKFTSPFASNVNINCQNTDNLQVDARVLTSSASASVDSNKLYASCNIESVVTVCHEACETVLVSSVKRENEKYEKVGATVNVYYPDEADTLFSVAKRFRTSGLKIARDNDISETVFAAENESGSLAGIKKILIY